MTDHVIHEETPHVPLPRFGKPKPAPAARAMWPMWASVSAADIAAIHRQLLATGRDVSVNVAEVPVRADESPHRCADHADYIGGHPPYECVVHGKRLYADEVGGEGDG